MDPEPGESPTIDQAPTADQTPTIDRALPIDRGWAWVVVAVCTALFSISAGGGKCLGVVMVELIDKFQDVYSPSTLLWVFMLDFVFDGLFGPLASYLIIKIGPRWSAFLGLFSLAIGNIGLAYSPNLVAMIFCHSIPTGFSLQLTSLVAITASNPYFSKRKALAIGLITCGSGIGALAIPPLLRLFFDQFGFSGALLLYGGVCIQLMCPSALLRPISYYSKTQHGDMRLPSTTKTQCETDMGPHSAEELEILNSIPTDNEGATAETECPPGESKVVSGAEAKEKFNWRVILMPKMIMISLCFLIYMLGFSVTYTCIPALARECGINDYVVSILMASSGAIELLCRIANGWLADTKVMSTTLQFALCVFLAGFFCLIGAIISNLPGIVLIIIGVSAVGSSVFSLEPLVFRELLGELNVTSSLGMQAITQCVSVTLSTTFSGLIYDHTGTWRNVFYYIAILMMLSSSIIWPFLLQKWCGTYRGRSSSPPINS